MAEVGFKRKADETMMHKNTAAIESDDDVKILLIVGSLLDRISICWSVER